MSEEIGENEILTEEVLPNDKPLFWADGADDSVTDKVRNMILNSPQEFGKLIDNIRILLKIDRYNDSKTKKLIELYKYLNSDNELCKHNPFFTYKYYSYLTDVLIHFEDYDYSNIVSNIDILSQQISSLFENVQQFNGFNKGFSFNNGRHNYLIWFLTKFNNLDEEDINRLIGALEDTEHIIKISPITLSEFCNDCFGQPSCEEGFNVKNFKSNFIFYLIGSVHKKYACFCCKENKEEKRYAICKNITKKTLRSLYLEESRMFKLGTLPEEITREDWESIVSFLQCVNCY